MKKLLLLSLCLLPLFAPASDFATYLENLDPRQVWQTPRGQMQLEIRPDVLDQFGIEVYQFGRQITARERLSFQIEPTGSLSFLAPYGNFEQFYQGRLELITGLEVRYQGRSIDLHRASLVPQSFHGQPGLAMVDARDRQIFNLSHFHVLAIPGQNRLELKNADVYPTAAFDELLGFPDHTALVMGMAVFDLHMGIPEGADTSQLAPACTSPTWPQDGLPADVGLIAIPSIVQMGSATTPDGGIKVTPSATLKNVGQADVPWVPKFGQIAQYTDDPRDQHPYLLWAMYRIYDGRIEMLANSGAKHAFFTVNTACACAGGNILWPDCEDVYGTSINDDGFHLGPRDEVVASQGLFESSCSFFDPDCTGSQTHDSGSGFQHRLVVHPDEFQQSGAQYFFDSWYVVQYDVDIWNTMGYRPISPSPVSGGWTFNPGTFTNGPPVHEWVAENSTDPMEGHRVVEVESLTPDASYPDDIPQGHLRVLVKVHDLGNGSYRYNYAIMNYDFDRGVREFTIPLAAGATVSETWMGGPPEVLDSPWPVSIEADQVVFTAPGDAILPWFALYNFEVVVDQVPVEGGAVHLGAAGEGVPLTIGVEMQAPGIPSRIFHDRFGAAASLTPAN